MPAALPVSSPTVRRWRPPGQCEVCRGWGVGLVCADCVQRFAPPVHRCDRCAIALPPPATRCGACLIEPPPFGLCVAAVDYTFPWDRLVAALKFRDRVELAVPLAERMQFALARAGAPRPDRLLPVPLAPRRLAERGYNQAFELARSLARSQATAADATLLTRPLDGAHQADLPLSQRLKNPRGAFLVEPARRAGLHGLHVALVDDVMTTGATLREAARTLLRAGAARVDAWVLARTPAPGSPG